MVDREHRVMSEPKLYHVLPPNMHGATLYPLRELSSRYPETYADAIRKYDDHPDRQGIPDRPAPPLSCAWQDVVHCCPIHPHLLYLAGQEAGMHQGSRSFVEIPLTRVDIYPAAIFERDVEGREVYSGIDWEAFTTVTDVPTETRQWYVRLASLGLRGATFVGVPHVMIKGQIDITGLRVIDWVTGKDVG